MTVGEIIATWLKEHGYDGLCNEDCGCSIDDLMPCGETFNDCRAAYKRKATDEEKDELTWGGEYVYSPTKDGKDEN